MEKPDAKRPKRTAEALSPIQPNNLQGEFQAIEAAAGSGIGAALAGFRK